MIDNSIKEELMIKGIPSSAGIVIGPVFVYQVDTSYEFCEVTAKDFSNEVKKLNNAVKRVLAELKRIKKETKKSYGPKLADLFNLQIGLLEDRYLIEEIEKKIKDENLCASYSVFQVMQSKKKHFLTLDNEYFKDRASEMQDLKRKLINIIEDRDQIILQDKPAVIIAKDISPSDTMKMYQKNVLAFVTETGGINSHAAIMGRALDIPSVVGSQGIMTRIKNDDMVIVDGIKGEVIINPSDSTVEIYRKEEESYHQFEKRMLKTKMSKTFTKDKIRVNILANIEFTKELGIIKKYKADGIGLYRTESLFMNRDALASEEEQVKNYLEMAEAMKNLPVTIRTLDVGGDKILPDIYKTAELNPFLGWRAIRFCLDNEEIFLARLRAILR
ncbi:MAG: phosphoenolpyruvate--protein phosphotransferase, partial [Calditrichia bacterium]|nr:phosphoenolpyruvate--protein phosphotransferase [Calditrichia bacterium]